MLLSDDLILGTSANGDPNQLAESLEVCSTALGVLADLNATNGLDFFGAALSSTGLAGAPHSETG